MAQNGIDFLLDQHRQIQRLLDAVQEGTPQARQQSFDALRELLVVHETAEELILRPATRKEVEGGSAIADARMAEENEAKETLAKLEKLKAGEPEFDELFASFAGDVLTHASNEEA